MERLQIAEGMNWFVLCCTVIDLQQFQTSGDYMPMTGYNRRDGEGEMESVTYGQTDRNRC